MGELNLIAVGTATVAAFLVSSTWYGVLGNRLTALQGGDGATGAHTGPPPPWKIGVELLRSLTVATTLAVLVSSLDIATIPAGLGIGLVAWVAFPVTLLVGAAMWDDVPLELTAIHAGDWLIKLLTVTAIVTAWR